MFLGKNYPMSKFKRKIIFEKECKQYRPLSDEISLVASFEADAQEDDIDIDIEILHELADYELSTKKKQGGKEMLRAGGRYGNLVSITEELFWDLTLLSRAMHYQNKSTSRVTVPEIIARMHERIIFPSVSLEGNDVINSVYRRNKEKFNYQSLEDAKIFLTRVFSVNDGPFDLVEFYIPQATYHPMDVFRNLYLSIIEPHLVYFDDFNIASIFFTGKEFNKYEISVEDYGNYFKEQANIYNPDQLIKRCEDIKGEFEQEAKRILTEKEYESWNDDSVHSRRLFSQVIKELYDSPLHPMRRLIPLSMQIIKYNASRLMDSYSRFLILKNNSTKIGKFKVSF